MTTFKEYLDNHINDYVVRKLLPMHNIDKEVDNKYRRYNSIKTENNTAILRSYEAYQISSGYEVNSIVDGKTDYNSDKTNAFHKILCTEDNLLFNGCKSFDIKGLSDIAIVEYTGNLFTAIEKHKPSHVIANRSSLKNISLNIPYIECQFVENGVYYLFPEITTDIAEFVVWKDVYEDPEPFKEKGGSYFYEIYEWIAIAIHEPKRFIKVV